MKPEVLKLRNFGPFAEAEINFNRLDDIFLITGKTGSGKTTIFDAICFALYGRVPGSRGEHLTRLRSDYAAEGAECLVSLDFSVGENRYRVERSPKQEKQKKRGAGTTTVEESAVVYEIQNGAPRNPTSRKSEADARIRDIIGLEHHEFFKIVLLPQGEFAEFLKQNSTERQQVLSKLFPMEKVLAVQKFAWEKAKRAESEVREAGRRLEEISGRFSIGDYENLYAAAQEKLKKADAALNAIARETVKLQAVCAALDSEQKALGQIEAIQNEQKKNDDGKTDIEELEKKLSRSRQAQPLRPQLVLAEEARRNLHAAREEHAGLAEIKAQAEKANEEAVREAKAIPGMEKESRYLRETKPGLEELIAGEEKLLLDDKEQKRLAADIEGLARKKKACEEILATGEKELKELQKQTEEIERLEKQLETGRLVKEDLVQLERIAQEGSGLENEEKKLGKELASGEERIRFLKERVPIMQEELRLLKLEKETKEKADMASRLASGLKAGEPCPVCGSTRHPFPAATGDPVYGLAEKIESGEKALKETELELAKLHEKNENQRATREQRLARKQELLKAQGELFIFPPSMPEIILETMPEIPALRQDEFPAHEEAAKLLQEHSDYLSRVAGNHKELKTGAGRIPKLFQDISSSRQELSKIESEFIVSTGQEQNLRASIAQRRGRTSALLKEFENAGLTSGAADSRDALSRVEQRLDQLEKKQEELRTRREKAGLALAAVAAKEEEAARKYGEVCQKERGAGSELDQALAASPFPDGQSLKEAILDAGAESGMEEAITRWKDERIRLASTLSTARENLAAIQKEKACFDEGRGAEELKKRISDLETQQEKIKLDRDRLISEKAGMEKDKAAFEEAGARFETLRRETEKLKAIADDLKGNNPKKKSFDSWLLARYLSEVAAYASRRLERMSESRYSLLLDSGGESPRGRRGLELAVFDAYTGKTRPCATLSGGESFMASISLALGLADSIQARSGGVRLDAVFIDEGFGSLDETSLDKALGILDELRDHRMVALISHVAEMKSRIPCRIEIEKSGGGSEIQIRGSGP
ncbi:MAG: AAA family ATPase [Spirochaetales bacterium]|jgi:exonuclease SbcC|nr:AAA family ATPase [Spirochaetales bacterium]